MSLYSQLEPRSDIAQVYAGWRESRRHYNRLVLQRRLIKVSGATFMCGAFACMAWVLLIGA